MVHTSTASAALSVFAGAGIAAGMLLGSAATAQADQNTSVASGGASSISSPVGNASVESAPRLITDSERDGERRKKKPRDLPFGTFDPAAPHRSAHTRVVITVTDGVPSSNASPKANKRIVIVLTDGTPSQ